MKQQRLWSGAAAAGCALFLATAVAVQIAHPHAVAATPISDYLRGPTGPWLRGAYYVFAASLALLGGLIIGTAGPRRYRCGGALLIVTAFCVFVVAYTYSPWPLPAQPTRTLRNHIHLLSATLAFSTVTAAMFLATPLVWRDRGRRIVYLYLGVIFFDEVLAAVEPAFLAGSFGALEKLAIAGIVLWLIAAALRLRASRT